MLGRAWRVAKRALGMGKKPRRIRVARGPMAKFAGASTSRLNDDWWSKEADAVSELRNDFPKLRERGRDLAQNTSFGRRATEIFDRNVVGPRGMKLQCDIRSNTRKPLDDYNQRTEDAFTEWAESEWCTVDGLHDFVGAQHLFGTARFRDGEGIIRCWPFYDNPWGFSIQILDTNLLDHRLDRPRGRDARGNTINEIRMGVEIDGFGRPLFYYFKNDSQDANFHNPGLGGYDRVSADRVCHWYKPFRPGWTRGVSEFYPVMLEERMLHGLQEAELVASRAAASKFATLEVDPNFAEFYFPEEDDKTQLDLPEVDIEAGETQHLPPGYHLNYTDPTHPNSAFPEFNKIILHSIAAGLDMPYTDLTGDLSNVNFTSIREGKLDSRDRWRVDQNSLEPHLRKIYRWWLQGARLAGRVPLNAQLPFAQASRHHWQGRAWDWVQPVDDIKATEQELGLGLTSHRDVLAAKGQNLSDVLRQRKADQDLAAEIGVDLPVSTKQPKDDDDDNEGSGGDVPPTNGAAANPGASVPLPTGPRFAAPQLTGTNGSHK